MQKRLSDILTDIFWNGKYTEGCVMMQKTIEIKTPLDGKTLRKLRSGDPVNISGVIYAARDEAHRRMYELIKEGLPLPFDIKNQIIYYVGPCPARPGEVIGSAGPTTSGRMDLYTPALINMGLTGMIGKGFRSKTVIESMVRYGSVYFGATGGAGALIARSIKSEEVIAFPELGPEAIRKLVVENLRVIVVIDSYGNDLYETGRMKYRIDNLKNSDDN
jgi:fumarate hydratase subunit beta